MDTENTTPAQRAIALANEFLTRVWGATHDLDAIDELMTEDYCIRTGGKPVIGRTHFKEWVRHFQTIYKDAFCRIDETFANEAGDRVVSRWFDVGINNGMFGFQADGRAVEFSGIAIWRVQNGKLAECWVERAAFEAFQRLSAT